MPPAPLRMTTANTELARMWNQNFNYWWEWSKNCRRSLENDLAVSLKMWSVILSIGSSCSIHRYLSKIMETWTQAKSVHKCSWQFYLWWPRKGNKSGVHQQEDGQTSFPYKPSGDSGTERTDCWCMVIIHEWKIIIWDEKIHLPLQTRGYSVWFHLYRILENAL